MPCEFQIGDIVEVADKIDTDVITTAVVKLVEKDEQIEDLEWLYLSANDISLNINYDSRVGNFWCIIESNSDYIRLVSKATMI